VSWNLADWYEVDEQKLGVVSRDELKHAERRPAVVAALGGSAAAGEQEVARPSH